MTTKNQPATRVVCLCNFCEKTFTVAVKRLWQARCPKCKEQDFELVGSKLS